MQKNPQLTERVKQLRVKDEYTWRSVADRIAQEFPGIIETWEYRGILCVNQMDGIDLCDAAMEYFNEDIEDGWN